MSSGAIIVGDAVVGDEASCSGCGLCELACSLFHEGVSNPELARLHVRIDPFGGSIKHETCMQCGVPRCIEACPVEGAMRIDEATGAKLIVVERCTGCGECARACPFNKNSSIVKFDQSRGVYVKCDLCLGRDGGPICVEICQMGALRYIKAARG